MSEELQSEVTQVVGKCPEDGVIMGSEIDYRFPNPCACDLCGDELEKVVIATEEEIQSYA